MDKLKEIDALIEVLNQLREKCPWDKKQTIQSLKNNTIEECYELIDAINNNDFDNIKEELGDILLHVLFYSKIAQEQGKFDIGDVAHAISQKLIYRHPHVFGDTAVSGSDEVVTNWEKLKRKEKGKKEKGQLSGVPSALPAIIKAYRISEKAAAVGFDWEDKKDVWAKVKEEISELETEVESDNLPAMKEELGDALFSLINLARKYKIDPEDALEMCNKKFMGRFRKIELHADSIGKEISDMTLEEMDQVWIKAKEESKQ